MADSEVQPLIFFDRTRAVRDDDCPRARWWAFEYEGRGVVSGKPSYHLIFGSAVHDALSDLAEGRGLEVALSAERREAVRSVTASFRGAMLPPEEVDRVCAETIALWEGLIHGANVYLLPKLREEYDIVATEYEATAQVADDVVLAAKPDLLLRRKSDGTLWYYEYKTTSSLRDQWFKSWDFAVQLMAGATVVAAQLGEPLAGCVIQALSKGYEMKGRLNSPFVYGYQGRTYVPGDPPYTYKWTPGSIKVPAWEQGSMAAWVGAMPDELLSAQFPATKPLSIRARQVDDWIAQRIVRERAIRAAREEIRATTETFTSYTTQEQRDARVHTIMLTHFPQHFTMCEPAYGGSPCSYQKLCYNPMAADDPLRFGYAPREPHHPTEQLYLEV